MPGGPFDDIKREFDGELQASRLRRAFQRWKLERPPLQRFEDLDALMAFQGDRSVPSPRRNEIAFVLCSLAVDDSAAKLLLLRLYVPGLTKRWHDLRKGVVPEEEVATELVTGFLIRSSNLDLGTRRLSDHLLGAARDRVRELIKNRLGQLASEFAAADLAALEAAGGRVVHARAEDAFGSTELSELIRQAEATAAIHRDHAESLRLRWVEGLTDKEAAARAGIRPGTARVRMSRATTKFRVWLRETRPPPEKDPGSL